MKSFFFFGGALCLGSTVVVHFIMFQIYDISTGKKIVKLYDSEKANNYKANRAIFNPTDDFVLNDGVLWDVRTCKAIHKFDKFNQYVSGDFHPAGLEIIINSEVVSFCYLALFRMTNFRVFVIERVCRRQF